MIIEYIHIKIISIPDGFRIGDKHYQGSSIAIAVVQNANTNAITNTTKGFILNASFS
jgi:hypothetical protein